MYYLAEVGLAAVGLGVVVLLAMGALALIAWAASCVAQAVVDIKKNGW
jgi:hypothetical protein